MPKVVNRHRRRRIRANHAIDVADDDLPGALLDGWRGSPALDVDAVAGIIASVGALLLGTPNIREIDLNPVVVYPQGAVALDALILAD